VQIILDFYLFNRYLSDAARSSCTSDDLNNTSSTLRQEAISLTRVRCKRRKTWIRSPTLTKSSTTHHHHHRHQHRLNTDLIQPFLSVNQGERFQYDLIKRQCLK